MGRETSKLSSPRRGGAAAAMEEGGKNTNSPQKWACSSLSQSDKFSSLYEKVHEGSVDWDQKNIESLVCSQYLQESPAQPAVPKPRSKIVFPHIMTRGTVVGNKVYCKTSINNCFTWGQRSSVLCASSSMMFVNFYHERSSDIQSGIARIGEEEEPLCSDPADDSQKSEHPLVSKQCRTLLLSVAGAAGMQLICPALRLPLLEVLLFSHQKWPTRRRSIVFNRGGRGGGGGAWWRFPMNLALAVSRPFYGSLLRRSLTAVLFIIQLRIKRKMEQRSTRYMPDLYSIMLLEKGISVDRELSLSPKFLDLDSSTDAQVENLSWEHSSLTCSEDGDNSIHVKELIIKMGNDCSPKGPGAPPQDVISDDGLPSIAGSCEQDVISDEGEGLSSDGDSSEDEISSIGSDSSVDSDMDDYNLGHVSDDGTPEARAEFIAQPYDPLFSQPCDESPAESVCETALDDTLTSDAQFATTSDFFTSSVKGSSDSDSVVATDDSEEIVEKFCLLVQQDRECAEDTLGSDLNVEEQISPTSVGGSELSFALEQQTETVEDEVEKSAVIDRGFSDELQQLQEEDDCSCPSEMSRQNSGLFVRASSSGTLESSVAETESSTHANELPKLQVSPRADLTALTSEDYDSGSDRRSGTWEIEVDGLAEDPYSVVWTPFGSKKRRRDSWSEDSEFSDDFTADDTNESCQSAGSQVGLEGEVSDEERFTAAIVQSGDSRGEEDCRPSSSEIIQEREIEDCVQIESDNNFSVDFSSVKRCLGPDLEACCVVDAGDGVAHEYIPSSSTRISENEAARHECEFASVDGLRESEAEIAEITTGIACESDGKNLKVLEAAMPRLTLTIPLDGEEECGLRAVNPDHFDRSSDASSKNSLTCRQDISPASEIRSHDRESLAAEMLCSDDCDVDAVREENFNHLSALTSVDSGAEECPRFPDVAHIDKDLTVEQHLLEDKSLEASPSSSRDVSDQGDTSSEARSADNSASTDESSESSGASLFADHPTCLELRQKRHSHGDQSYLELAELHSEPWRSLVYWHGRCQEGRPTLVVLLGKAVRQLSTSELKHFITVTISHAEYAELNYFKGAVKQMNILMDLDGLGFMRLPPMHVMQSIGTILNRDYAGRGGWIFLINAPMMLGLVISAIQRVILRPSYTKGAVIDKGFLEGKERIMTLGGRYRSTLLKHFDEQMLPSTLGGSCPCGSKEASQCSLGVDSLAHYF